MSRNTYQMHRGYYDAAVVFGMRYDRPRDPENFFNSLDAAAWALQAGRVGYIAVSGKGWMGADPESPLPTECQAGLRYLQQVHGIRPDCLLPEPDSTSSVDNMLNLKRRYVLGEPHLQSFWSPIAGYTILRRSFIARKVMGPDVIEFAPVECPADEVWDMEAKSYRQHLTILGPMPDGRHTWLLDKHQESKWGSLMTDHLRLTEPELFLPGGPLAEMARK